MNRELYMEFFQISVNTFYLWKKQKRPVIEFFSKYSTDEETKEFIKTGKIDRIDKLNFLLKKTISKYKRVYISSFTNNFNYKSLDSAHEIFKDFYFQFLCELKKIEILDKYDFHSLLYASLHKYLLKKYIYASSEKNIQKELEELEIIDNSENQSEYLNLLEKSNQKNFFDIQKHFNCFQYWDEGMLFFLDFNLKDNLKSFLGSKDEELLYHAIGLNVYSEIPELEQDEKLCMITNITKELIKSQDEISLEKVLDYIKKYKNDIDIIKLSSR